MAGQYNTVGFSDIFIRQSQNSARLAFEVQFTAVKRRLNIELNDKKAVYNNMDKTLEPVLADLKRERVAVEKQRTEMTTYLENSRRNINKLSDTINQILPKLSNAASNVGPTASADFDRIRDQMNKAMQSLTPNSSLENGIYDKVAKFKGMSNPSQIQDYAGYGSVSARASDVGVFISSGNDVYGVDTFLSRGLGEQLGLLRYHLSQDFDVAKARQEAATQKLKEIDKAIEKKDAQERLVVLKEIQALEKRNEQVLKNLSLNFEFSQAKTETFADRSSFLKPQKGSIMNLFI